VVIGASVPLTYSWSARSCSTESAKGEGGGRRSGLHGYVEQDWFVRLLIDHMFPDAAPPFRPSD
jgi:hypothetical protein